MSEDISSKNVGLGFLVVFLSGLSTALGALVVFFPKLVRLASRQVFASALAISAGVMVYIAFLDIFPKSFNSFDNHLVGKYEDDDRRSAMANLFATLSFFAGVALNSIIEYFVRMLSDEQHDFTKDAIEDIFEASNKKDYDEEGGKVVNNVGSHDRDGIALQEESLSPQEDPIQRESSDTNNDTQSDHQHHGLKEKKLMRMSFQTAIAIALHNFPEGLATFVAYLNEPVIGVIFAFAIALHNIPEGFCVALPLYYATGQKGKAFLWGSLSGFTEPIGALIGWLFFMNGMSPLAYGILFGFVGGMMVMIALTELLPTAFKYDPSGTLVSKSLIAGMLIMALSLVLLPLGGAAH